MMLNRARCVQARCDASRKDAVNPVVAARKRFEKKRSSVLKDNFNKIVLIGTAEIADVKEFLVELDQIHKKEVEGWFNKDPKQPEVVDADNIFSE